MAAPAVRKMFGFDTGQLEAAIPTFNCFSSGRLAKPGTENGNIQYRTRNVEI